MLPINGVKIYEGEKREKGREGWRRKRARGKGIGRKGGRNE